MNFLLRKILSLFLLATFLFAITPCDIIHEFTDHKDSHDYYPGEGAMVSNHHLHCESLLLQLQTFQFEGDVFLPSAAVNNALKNYEFPESFRLDISVTASLRGPPVFGC